MLTNKLVTDALEYLNAEKEIRKNPIVAECLRAFPKATFTYRRK